MFNIFFHLDFRLRTVQKYTVYSKRNKYFDALDIVFFLLLIYPILETFSAVIIRALLAVSQ